MHLKTKTKLLFWSITALFVIPAVLLALLALLSYVIPVKAWRDDLTNDIVRAANDLSLWRQDVCERFYAIRRDGYILTIK